MKLGSASSSPAIESNRVRGVVFAFHDKDGVGHARLSDNRRVWLRVKELLPGVRVPRLRETIEFELRNSVDGLEAVSISIVDNESNNDMVINEPESNSRIGHKTSHVPDSSSASMAEAHPDTSAEKAKQIENESTESDQPSLADDAEHLSSTDQIDADAQGEKKDEIQKLFAQAAVAGAEGRIQDARQFFERAIKSRTNLGSNLK